MPHSKTVLLTGISGFIGMHTAVQLLAKGYTVRGTLRHLDRAAQVRETIGKHAPVERLDIVACDLLDADSWMKASEGVDYVQHIASPLPHVQPKNRDELIVPARDGALNVLRAARANGVKRVVMTSSIAAIGYGHKNKNRVFSEKDWTNPSDKKDVTPYSESKTRAEQKAWEFAKENQPFELVTVNPSYVLGPALDPDFSASMLLIKKMLDGDMPGAPRMWVNIVDVRDVAAMHLLAMEHPQAAGKRFICSAGGLYLLEIGQILRRHFPQQARKTPTFTLPDFLVRLFSLFDKETANIVNELSLKRVFDASEAKKVLGWTPGKLETAVTDAATSLIELGVV
ncbi:MAG: aldehyde reductase [Cyclobacteriaceae bacterium]|nr:aldehyde reductase [Cyclobacteriaceae bacterium]